MTESTALLILIAGTPGPMAVLAGVAFARGLIGVGLGLISGALALGLTPIAIMAAQR